MDAGLAEVVASPSLEINAKGSGQLQFSQFFNILEF
jgi:hypothetical protein